MHGRLVVLFVIAATIGLAGQEPGGRAGPPQGGEAGRSRSRSSMPSDGSRMGPAEIQKIFDGYLIVQVKDALLLNDQLFAQLIPRITQLQDIRRRHQLERLRLINDLQRLSRPTVQKVDEVALRERLAALQEHDTRLAADVRNAYHAIDELLDVRQQARFRVFEETLERKKLELLLRVRQNRPGPPGR